MPNDTFSLLVRRSVAIVAEAVARFELLLDRHAHVLTDNEQGIADWLQTGLATSKVLLRGQLQLLHSNGQPTDTSSLLAFSRISNFLAPLQANHLRLRHLSIPTLLRESVVFVERAWQAWTARTGLTPSLCLANEFEPSEHQLEAHEGKIAESATILGGDKTVVALAKIDYANPLNWPLLVHEIGHAAIRGRTFPNTEQLSSHELDWLLELGCDRIAIRLCGPSFLAAYSSQAILKFAYFTASTGHPAPGHRADILRQHAPAWVKSTRLFHSLEPLLDARLVAEKRLQGTQGDLPDTISLFCPMCTTHVANYSRSALDKFASIAADFFSALDEQVSLVDRSATADGTLQTLERRLAEGVLIGSSRSDAATLSSTYDAVDRKRSEGLDVGEQEVHRLKDAVCDTPNNIFDIIHAGWNRYLVVSDARITQLQREAAATDDEWPSAWRQFRDAVAGFDQLLLSSIETSEFHGLISELRHYGDAQ